MLIEPIGDRVLIKPNPPEQKSKGGLVFTKKDDEKQDQGVITSVGKGTDVAEFKAGDEIIYQKYGPADVEIDKEKFVIVHIDEILGKVING